MVAPRESRAQLLRRLGETMRKVGAQSVLISDLVATRVGLNSTDLECLDVLYLAGVTTAGTLSRHTGLTTGATTAVIDRLERAGFVRRRRDADDRRCVLVEVVPSSAERIEPFYAPLARELAALNDHYEDRELATVVEYMSRALELGAAHVVWLQQRPAATRRPTARQAPERRAARRGPSTRRARSK
jgi:DNA-binding MarR family transcriptional regulator